MSKVGMKWGHTFVLAAALFFGIGIGGALVFAGQQLVDTLVASGTMTFRANGATQNTAPVYVFDTGFTYGCSSASVAPYYFEAGGEQFMSMAPSIVDNVVFQFWNIHEGGACPGTPSKLGWMSFGSGNGAGTGMSLYGDFNVALGLGVGDIGTTVNFSGNDLTYKIGSSSDRRTQVWSRQYGGVEQVISNAATITLDPSSGETIEVNLGATATTTVNGAAGFPGEKMVTAICQDSSGGRSIGGWASGTNGFRFSSTAYTVTSTANKCDVITWDWIANLSSWVEASRSMGD